MRALAPNPNFSTFFPVIRIVLDLTKAYMPSKLEFEISKISRKHTPWQPLAIKTKYVVHQFKWA